MDDCDLVCREVVRRVAAGIAKDIEEEKVNLVAPSGATAADT